MLIKQLPNTEIKLKDILYDFVVVEKHAFKTFQIEV